MSDINELYKQAEKLKDMGQTDEAVKTLNLILEQDPNHVLSHLTLARIYTLTGQHDLAVEHGQRACDLEPNDSFNHTALSITYQRAFAGTNDRRYITLAEDAMARARQLGG